MNIIVKNNILCRYEGEESHVVIPDGVTSIGDCAFRDNKSLISVTIPSSVTSIGDEAFYDCKSLTSATIQSPIITIGRGAFAACKRLVIKIENVS